MTTKSRSLIAFSLAPVLLASCASANDGDSAPATAGGFAVAPMGEFEEPWAIRFAPGTQTLFVTEKAGTLKVMDTASGTVATVAGVPQVDYGGQGGLGDVAFLPGEAGQPLDGRVIYLSWAEAGQNDMRGAAVGRGILVCAEITACRIKEFSVIWRQDEKVTGRGHYSHRIAFDPNGRHMYIASGDRQKMLPAQDLDNNLGTIVRLKLDGAPAKENPFEDRGGTSAQIWSYGHRNILGMAWDDAGRLWEVEHGPAGGDELNLVKRAANYGWPLVSDGDHYNGNPIPANSTRPDLAAPVINWTPVIAPSDMLIHSGRMFGAWKGQALITGLSTEAIIRIAFDGETAREAGRYPMGRRLRSLTEGPDGAVWVAEDGKGARLLKLTPQ
ncbi:MAG: dehydrogenase [Erythrobacter sp. SCN 68-10]|nr:MAG: dehydrogenase [Erythrobacter sp. SCN 68-10]